MMLNTLFDRLKRGIPFDFVDSRMNIEDHKTVPSPAAPQALTYTSAADSSSTQSEGRPGARP